MIGVFYATHELAGYPLNRVVLLDDTIPEEFGLIQSGYFEQINTPERHDNEPQSPNRAG
jgi:hypothetical protein